MISKEHVWFAIGIVLGGGGFAAATDINPGNSADFDNGCVSIEILQPGTPWDGTGSISGTDLGEADRVEHRVIYDFDGTVLLGLGLCPNAPTPCPSLVVEFRDLSDNLVVLNGLLDPGDRVLPLETAARASASFSLFGGKFCRERTNENGDEVYVCSYVWNSQRYTVSVNRTTGEVCVTYSNGIKKCKTPEGAPPSSMLVQQAFAPPPIKQRFSNNTGNTVRVTPVDEKNPACGQDVIVPAASQWGLAVMTLLIVAAGSVAVRARTPRVER